MNQAAQSQSIAPEDTDADVDAAVSNDGTEPEAAETGADEEIRTVKRVLEAILFASADPVPERVLANRVPEGLGVKDLLKDLQSDYEGRGIQLIRAGASWAFRTAEDLGPVLNVETEVERKLSRAAMETLAIIAYHQPVSRAEIEEIRGVGLSKGTLDLLFEKNWIKPKGRRESPGRPMTWGTTDEFLDHFGLAKIGDLPGMDDLKAAGLLETAPALNVYRSRGSEEAVDPGPPKPAEQGVLPEIDDTEEAAEPLDPDAA